MEGPAPSRRAFGRHRRFAPGPGNAPRIRHGRLLTRPTFARLPEALNAVPASYKGTRVSGSSPRKWRVILPAGVRFGTACYRGTEKGMEKRGGRDGVVGVDE